MSSKVEFSKWWWNDENSQNKVSASEEALRKYYSVKEYVTHGTPKVCTAPYIGSISPRSDDLFDRLNRILDKFGRDIETFVKLDIKTQITDANGKVIAVYEIIYET